MMTNLTINTSLGGPIVKCAENRKISSANTYH